MLSKNSSIVLSKLKYREYDLIVKCYTEQRGVVSYLLRGVLKSKKGLSKTVYFQALSQLEIEEVYKPNQSLHAIKEVKFSYVYSTLHNNIFKSSIVLFLSEILSNVLKEEEKNEDLFHFMATALQYLDNEDQFSNFHLLFLLKLTRYLGFQPESVNTDFSYFNLETGVFENSNHGIYSVSGENLIILKQLLGTNFDALNAVKITGKQRQEFLNMLLYYFELHLGSFKKPRSLQVLNDVFH
ncbi:DNA replication and repair protein RecO [Winogradskyella epiphytica]|uniref:DNA repair protein RecO n=1 Tax=Winogradskyella epiphytica TaxID=262005 RepID=A0A2V4WZP1_9FLAO|nr:DNA repair protein RecO [Winogradskyella epiphytica]PYE83122.1 DNA replication and repair protein RecO [Winogradskyella epiphytica]GGW55949.1 DNA repair protein RecO [Winogradskyella epiphytica]